MCLGTLSEFQNRYEKPILEGQKYNCTKRQLAMSRKSEYIHQGLFRAGRGGGGGLLPPLRIGL